MTRQDNKAPIDLDMLTMALQVSDLDTGWWLDISSGEVIPGLDPKGSAQEQSVLQSRRSNPDRYIDIEPLPTAVLVDLMQSFISTLHEHSFCNALRQALRQEQAAWHFKRTLANNSEHEESWYAFKEQFYALQARQWAREQGLEYEIKSVLIDQDNNFARTLNTSQGQILMVLALPGANEHRRYVVWQSPQQPGEVTLTVYRGADESVEQVIGETSLDQKQLESINHVLGQMTADIQLLPIADSTQTPQARLQINAGENQINLSSTLKAGTIQDQLQTLFNFLLGISPVE